MAIAILDMIHLILTYSNLYFFASGLAFLSLSLLIIFVYTCEPKKKRATPFNMSLFSFGAFLTALYFLEGFVFRIAANCLTSGKSYLLDFRFQLAYFWTYMLGASFKFSYLFYSWKRAGPVLQDVFPQTCNYMLAFVKFLPVTFYCQGIPSLVSVVASTRQDTSLQTVLDLQLASNSITAATEGLLLLTDVVLIVGFIKFVRKTRMEGVKTDRRFLLISYHGIGSATAIIMAFVLFSVYSAYNDNFACGYASLFLWLVSFYILCSMKLFLFWEESAKRASTTSIMEGKSRTSFAPVKSKVIMETDYKSERKTRGSFLVTGVQSKIGDLETPPLLSHVRN